MSAEGTVERAEDFAAALASDGLLTERQALAYVCRDVEGLDRARAAEVMGCSVNVVDKHLRAARDKLSSAVDTIERFDRRARVAPSLVQVDLRTPRDE